MTGDSRPAGEEPSVKDETWIEVEGITEDLLEFCASLLADKGIASEIRELSRRAHLKFGFWFPFVNSQVVIPKALFVRRGDGRRAIEELRRRGLLLD